MREMNNIYGVGNRAFKASLHETLKVHDAA